MSDKECNLCTWQRIQEQAKEQGKAAVLLPGRHGYTDSFIAPPDVDLKSMTRRQRRKYQRVSFLVIPDKCACE